MKEINTSFCRMVAAIPAEIKQKVDLEIAISNCNYELKTKRRLAKVEFVQALSQRPSEVKWLSGQHNFTLRTISLLSVFFGESLITID